MPADIPMNFALLAGFTAVALSAQPAGAQTLSGVKIEPATAQPGEAVKVMAQFDLGPSQSCNVRIHFGDGTTTDATINHEKDSLLVLPYTYQKPGSYTVMVEPRTKLASLKCSGGNQKAVVTILAPPPAGGLSAAPAAHATAPVCPTGWKLNASSVNTGAFQCNAKPGTAAPLERLACPGILNYYQTSSQLGCRP